MFKIVGGQFKKNFNYIRDRVGCRCGCNQIVVTKESQDFDSMAQEFREEVAEAMHVNSWNRCEKHNAAEGGSSTSLHKDGRAADFRNLRRKSQNQCRTIWFRICKRWGYGGGFGYYNGRFHLDNRSGVPVVWDKR